MGTDTKIYDNKVTKIRKAETGVAGEKSVSSDGNTTVVNKQTTAVAKVQKGGSTVKKTRASKREWAIMPSSDLNKNILVYLVKVVIEECHTKYLRNIVAQLQLMKWKKNSVYQIH